ncbi:MAG TPA: hypothetical protein ACFYD0_14515 [Candidatus Wunengus sp. YC65]|uniref:hypothetical protein n=1 Tax=Candidatus Wunengus sp. YC65 TaxID=3367701 RepID=UPI004029D7A7
MKSISALISIFILSLFLLFLVPYQSLSQNKDTSEAELSATNNYYLNTARIYFEQKDYTKAVDALELAILLEPNNEEVLALLKRSRKLLDETSKSVAASGKLGVTKETEAKAAYPEDIFQLLQCAHTAIQEERYDDAAKIADLILTRDPANKEALYIKEKVNGIKHKHTTENLKTTLAQEKLKSHEYLKEASVPYQDTLRFPAKEQWTDITKRTLPELDKIVEENRIKTEQLRLNPNPAEVPFPKVIENALNTIISFEFLDTPLKDIVIFIREKTNINMIIDSEAGNVPVTLKLKDVPLRTALKYILPKGYEYVVEGDIIHIYKQKMEMRVYDVRDVLINLDDKEPLKFDITAAVTSQMGLSKGAETVKAKDASERVLDLIELIVTTVEPSSWSHHTSVIGASATGGQRSINISGQGEGSINARTGQPGDLVVVNSKYVHKQIEDMLASLRSSQNLQVSIEARFIEVTDKFLEEIGSSISKFFSKNTSVNTGGGTGEILDETLSGEGLQLNYSILNNSMLKGFLSAVQESKDSEILTSPRITLSNTQRGNIAVVKTINYVQSTSVSEGVVTPVIGTIPEGTTFDVRPIVSADRKYIYLEVTPSVFQVEEITSFTFSGLSTDVTVGGGGAGSSINVPPEQTVQLPKVNVSQVSVTVCVPDKGTLMIGGLGSINKSNLTSGIPILSKIPVLKRLFSLDQKKNKKSNLVILLKPTIIIKEEQEANFFSLSNRNFNAADSNNNK